MQTIDSHDLLVIGGGPAGLSAALKSSKHGVKTAIIEERITLGGQIFKRLGVGFKGPSAASLGKDYARGAEMISAIKNSNIEVFDSTQVVSIEDSIVYTTHPNFGTRAFKYKNLIIAPGAYDRPVVFPGWTLPGVMTAGAVQTLVKTQQLSPGKKILFAGSGPLALAFSAQLLELGAPVYKVLESSHPPKLSELLRLTAAVSGNWNLISDAIRYRSILLKKSIPFKYRRLVVKAEGQGRVESVTHCKVDQEWRPIKGTEEVESVDLLCVGYGFFPSHEIFRFLGCSFVYDENQGGFKVEKDQWGETSVPGIFAAGDGTGVTGSYSAIAQGALAGLKVAFLHGNLNELQLRDLANSYIRELSNRNRFQKALNHMFDVRPGIYELADDQTIVCRCESVRKSGIDSVIESTSDISVVKAYTRAGMGLCQGRNCQRQIAAMISKRHTLPFSEIPFATPRFPFKPVEIGLIADGSIRDEKYFINEE
ncbi:MAG: FAD-dependent oxidoreductase [Micrococcales bacterium]|nr:FAD-dependent oxidoreductase [Micrococcales bacterium]